MVVPNALPIQQAVSTGQTSAMGVQRGALGRQGSKLRARSKARMDSALPDREAGMSEDDQKDDDYLYQQNPFGEPAAPAGPGFDFD